MRPSLPLVAGLFLVGATLRVLAESGQLRLPGPREGIGLGSAVKRATSAAGVVPCMACQERAAQLDRRVWFGG